MAADGFDVLRRARDQAVTVEPPIGAGPDAEDGPPPAPDESGEALPDLPVTPLGKFGDVCFYLDDLNQLVELRAEKHSKLAIEGLFGRRAELLDVLWPRKSWDKRREEWVVTGWRNEQASRALMGACAHKGVWSAMDRVRGAGAWAGPDGELVLHLGDKILVVPADGGEVELLVPGQVGELVYPTAPTARKPARRRVAAAGCGDNPAATLLEILRSWHWRRPEIDPYLLLGWICAAMLGGALPWRVVAWITGGAGTGKSTLQGLIKHVFGPAGMLQTADGTAAGVRQVLKYASLPVGIDEAEADADIHRQFDRLGAVVGSIIGVNDHSVEAVERHHADFTAEVKPAEVKPE